MTKFVIATLEFGVGDPNWHTALLGEHPSVYVIPHSLPKIIGTSSECTDPQLPLYFIADTLDSIFQAAITARVALEMPKLIL